MKRQTVDAVIILTAGALSWAILIYLLADAFSR